MTEQLIENQEWSVAKKLLLLYVMSYLFLYMFPFPIQEIPFISDICVYYYNVIDFIILWIGNNILQIQSLWKIERQVVAIPLLIM